MYKFHDVDQNSDDWFSLRLGKFTASLISDLFSKPSTVQYKKAIYKVAFERAFNRVPEDAQYSSAYMERGHELEPMAVEAYEERTFSECTNGGFFELNEWVGASPDRVVSEKLGLEVKCPAFNTMVEYSLDYNHLKKKYYTQVQAQMYVCGFESVDLVAYHPDFKLITVRIDRDEDKIYEIEKELTSAIESVKHVQEKLSKCVA